MYKATTKEMMKSYVNDLFIQEEEVILEVDVVTGSVNLNGSAGSVQCTYILKGDILRHTELAFTLDPDIPVAEQVRAAVLAYPEFLSIQAV